MWLRVPGPQNRQTIAATVLGDVKAQFSRICSTYRRRLMSAEPASAPGPVAPITAPYCGDFAGPVYRSAAPQGSTSAAAQQGTLFGPAGGPQWQEIRQESQRVNRLFTVM